MIIVKSKIFIIGLLLVAVLSAGCIDFTVFSTYEEVAPTVVAYSGTVTDHTSMDSPTSDYGNFPASTSGMVLFRNSNDVVTKTATASGFNVIMDYTDSTANGVAGKLTGVIVKDYGGNEEYAFTNIVDYDGYWKLSGFHPANDFGYYDEDGNGVVDIFLKHDSSDANSITVRKVFIQVEYSTTPPPPTGTGSVAFYTNPTGASIYVDGNLKGTTSIYAYAELIVPDLSAGSHSWSISKSGYNTVSGTVNVVAGDTVTVTQDLTAVVPGEPEGPTNTPPTAIITAVQPSQSMVVFNSDKSTDSDGYIVSREWSLNGKAVTNAVQYQFVTSDKETGTYTVQLTVTDDDGATATAQYIITLEGKTITDTQVVTTPISDTGEPISTGEEPTVDDDKPITFTIPGFDAVLALIGLLTVVWLIKRKEE